MAFEINWTNSSSSEWYRIHEEYTEDVIRDTLSTAPSETLQPIAGGTSMSMSSNILSFLAGGNIYIQCCFYDKKHDEQFGMRLWHPIQFGPFGHSPYWYVSHGTANSEPIWIKHEDDSASPFSYPLDNYSVVATPTKTHTSIVMNILISDI